MMRLVLRVAAAFRVNLNWLMDPVTAFSRRETLFSCKQWQASRLGPTIDSPVILLFREWVAAMDQAKLSEDADGAQACDLVGELQGRILAAPATCPADFVAKVIALTLYGECALPSQTASPDLWAEASRFIR